MQHHHNNQHVPPRFSLYHHHHQLVPTIYLLLPTPLVLHNSSHPSITSPAKDAYGRSAGLSSRGGPEDLASRCSLLARAPASRRVPIVVVIIAVVVAAAVVIVSKRKSQWLTRLRGTRFRTRLLVRLTMARVRSRASVALGAAAVGARGTLTATTTTLRWDSRSAGWRTASCRCRGIATRRFVLLVRERRPCSECLGVRA